MNRQIAFVPLAAALVLVACSESGSDTAAASAASNDTSWLLTAAPAEAAPVSAAKSTAEEGQEIVIRGRIGGRVEPISGESSVFTIVDLEVPYCGQLNPEDDHCATPWDYCCESPSNLMAATATVQLVDSGGLPIDTDPVAAGLSPLDEVVVVGVVGARPSPEVLMIRATGVHRVGG